MNARAKERRDREVKISVFIQDKLLLVYCVVAVANDACVIQSSPMYANVRFISV